jgi:ORF6N domain
MFQLTPEEGSILRFEIGMSKGKGRGGRRYLPYVFTEQGVAMLSSVLRGKRAVQVNVEIMRALVRLRRMLASNEDLARKLAALEKKYDAQFRVVFEPIRELRPQPVWCRLVIDPEKSVNQSSLTRGRRKRLLELGAESRRIFQIS